MLWTHAPRIRPPGGGSIAMQLTSVSRQHRSRKDRKDEVGLDGPPHGEAEGVPRLPLRFNGKIQMQARGRMGKGDRGVLKRAGRQRQGSFFSFLRSHRKRVPVHSAAAPVSLLMGSVNRRGAEGRGIGGCRPPPMYVAGCRHVLQPGPVVPTGYLLHL